MRLLKYGFLYILITILILTIFFFSEGTLGYVALLILGLTPFLVPLFIFFSKKESSEKMSNLVKALISFIVAFPCGVIAFMFISPLIGHSGIDGMGWWVVVSGFMPYAAYSIVLLCESLILGLILKFRKPNIVTPKTPSNY